MEQQQSPTLYGKANDSIRIDSFQELDSHLSVALRSFFRRLGAPHMYHEWIVPTLEGGESSVFAAVRDRPWPPWGIGGRKICALCQVHPVSPGGVGITPLYVAVDDATNIGLMAALYAEVLDDITRQSGTEVNYLVAEGSVLADRLLSAFGFKRSEDLVVSDEGRYAFYRTDAGELRSRLGFDRVSVPELLAHEIDDETFQRIALYFSGLDLASQPNRFVDRVRREIILIDGGLFDASLPGGVPPTPPTALPTGLPGDFERGPLM